jgi:hypothetical protein
MSFISINRNVRAKLAALAVVGVCAGTVAVPAAVALNPQPLPPKAVQPVASPPILIGGFLTCHEYGCL